MNTKQFKIHHSAFKTCTIAVIKAIDCISTKTTTHSLIARRVTMITVLRARMDTLSGSVASPLSIQRSTTK